MLSNNTPENITKHRKKKKEKCIEKGKQYYKQNKERLQKWHVINTKGYLQKKKNKKEQHAKNWH